MASFTFSTPSPANPGDTLQYRGIADCETLKISVTAKGSALTVTPANPCTNGQFAFSVVAPSCDGGNDFLVNATVKDANGADSVAIAINCP